MGKRALDKQAQATKLVAFRCPLHLHAKLEAQGGEMTAVILLALERHLAGSYDEQAAQVVRDVAARLGVKP